MSRRVLIRSPPVDRRQPLLTNKPVPGEKKGRCAEVASGTAADCAAICCCCPCGLMNLLILAVYKVPSGLCKKVWQKKKRKSMMKKKKGLLPQQQQKNTGGGGGPTCCCDDSTVEMKEAKEETAGDGTTEAADLEKEMLSRFFGTGFWRTPSQREEY